MKALSSKEVIADLLTLAIKAKNTRSRKQRQIVRMKAGKVRKILANMNKVKR